MPGWHQDDHSDGELVYRPPVAVSPRGSQEVEGFIENFELKIASDATDELRNLTADEGSTPLRSRHGRALTLKVCSGHFGRN